MWSYHYYNDSFIWPFGSFFNILFWFIIIFGIIYLAANITSKSKPKDLKEPQKPDEAMDILRKRYASGEINQEEFNQKKKDLAG
jgi:putative membrane protein